MHSQVAILLLCVNGASAEAGLRGRIGGYMEDEKSASGTNGSAPLAVHNLTLSSAWWGEGYGQGDGQGYWCAWAPWLCPPQRHEERSPQEQQPPQQQDDHHSQDHQSGSCSQYGCGGSYKSGRPCQCTADCSRYGNCCHDYSDKCSTDGSQGDQQDQPAQHSHDNEGHLGNCVHGYHQTDPDAGHSIEKSGFDVSYASSAGDIAGSGLYFSTSIQATEDKAHHHGYCFEVQLCIGRSKELPRHPVNCCSYNQLKAEGYDSATIERGGFYYREYEIFRNDQIKIIRSWACNPDGSPQ